MSKELVPSQLDALSTARKALCQIREARLTKDEISFEENSKIQEREGEIERKRPIRKLRKLNAKCSLEEQLMDIPHLKNAFECEKPTKPSDGNPGGSDLLTKLQIKQNADFPPNN